MARVVVHSGPRPRCPLLALPGPRPGGVRPHKMPQPTRRRPRPLPLPQAGNILGRSDPTLRSGSVHLKRGNTKPPRCLLAQGPEMDNKLLLSHAHLNTFGGIMPPTSLSPDHPTAKAGGTQGCLLPS